MLESLRVQNPSVETWWAFHTVSGSGFRDYGLKVLRQPKPPETPGPVLDRLWLLPVAPLVVALGTLR